MGMLFSPSAKAACKTSRPPEYWEWGMGACVRAWVGAVREMLLIIEIMQGKNERRKASRTFKTLFNEEGKAHACGPCLSHDVEQRHRRRAAMCVCL